MDLAEKLNNIIWDKYCNLCQINRNSWHNILSDWKEFLEEFNIEVVSKSVHQPEIFFFDGYFFIPNFCSLHVLSYLKISYEVALKIILIGL